MPSGASNLFINADVPCDTPHPYAINLEDSSGKLVYSTDNMSAVILQDQRS